MSFWNEDYFQVNMQNDISVYFSHIASSFFNSSFHFQVPIISVIFDGFFSLRQF